MVQMDTSGRELDVVIKIPMSESGPHSQLVNDPTGDETPVCSKGWFSPSFPRGHVYLDSSSPWLSLLFPLN